jgi:hypothetical protein
MFTGLTRLVVSRVEAPGCMMKSGAERGAVSGMSSERAIGRNKHPGWMQRHQSRRKLKCGPGRLPR